MAAPFHLGWFQDGFRAPAWNQQWSGNSSVEWPRGGYYVDLARALERGRFDCLMLEDSNYVPDIYRGSTETYLKYGQRAPKHDPAALAPILAQATHHLGIVVTIATTEWQPFQVARYMSTLDHLSAGRAGWNMVTGSNDRAAQNFGHDKQPPHDERYDIADDFVETARELWDSWSPDAAVLDEERGIYVDHTAVRAIEHKGPYFSSRGPLNTLPSPQGRPVLFQAGSSGRGRDFAAHSADVIIAHEASPENMREFRDDIRRRAADSGRDPDTVKVLFLIQPILADTDSEARERARLQAQESQRDIELELSGMSSVTMVDLAQFDLDSPLPADLSTNAHQGTLAGLVASGRPLRQMVSGTRTDRFVGSPDTVAESMREVMEVAGGDGFLLTSLRPTRRYITEIVDGLIPALQRRGLVRSEYSHPTFRENLLAF